MSNQTPRGGEIGTGTNPPVSSRSKNGMSKEEEDEIMKEVVSVYINKLY